MRRLAIAAALACCLLGSQAQAMAAPADLDRSFGSGGIVDLVSAPAQQFPGLNAYAIEVATGPDETVFALSRGAECDAGGRCRYPLVVTRYASNGSPDAAYGERGSALVSIGGASGGQQASIAVDSQGRVLVATKSGDSVRVGRLGADGSLDRSFSEDGEAVAPGSRYAVSEITLSGDRVVVESDWFIQHPGNRNGHLKHAGKATTAVSVTRFLPDGRPDPSFGDAGTVMASFRRASPPRTMAVRPRSGGILLAGQTCCSPRRGVPYLVRILADGRVDRGFAHLPGLRRLRSSQGASVNALMLGRGGRIDLAGSVEWGRYGADRRGFLLRLRGDGTPNRRFGHDGVRLPSLPVDTAAIDSRGRIFAAFEESSSGDVAVFRLNSDGALDRSFSGGKGVPVRGAGGGEGGVVAFYPGLHPLLFNPRIFTCRSTCPPAPVLVRFAG